MNEIQDRDDQLLSEIEGLSQELDRLREHNQDLAVLSTISAAVSRSLQLQEVVDTALDQALSILTVDGGVICLYDKGSQSFVPAADRDVPDDVIQDLTAFEIGQGFGGQIAESARPVIVDDLAAAEEDPFPAATAAGLCFVAGLPITSHDELVGVMVLIAGEPGRISPARIGLLSEIGDRIGIAVENARTYRQAQQEIVERMVGDRERGKMMAHIQDQARRMQQVIDTLPEAVLLLDGEGRVTLANPLADSALATLADAEVGDVITHLGSTTLEDVLEPLPAGDWHEVGAHGCAYQVLARPLGGEPAEGDDDREWVMLFRDVTQVEAAAHMVRHHERLASLGQLAASIASQFRVIVSLIELYAAMSLRTSVLDDETHIRLENIDQHARRASNLVDQILDFSQRATLHLKPVDILELLRELRPILERSLPPGIALDISHDDNAHAVEADASRLRRIVLNLVDNAVNALPRGGRIAIAVARLTDSDNRDYVQLTVSDSGPGIPPSVLPHIFDPFFTTKSRADHLGFGLSQVYGIVQQHGGSIDVNTEAGGGTTLIVHLPAIPLLELHEQAPDPTSLRSGHNELLLVVEDDPDMRHAMVEALHALGYRTLESSSGQKALKAFEEHDDIRLVLCDAELPKMRGQVLFQALRQRDTDVRVILVTSRPVARDLETMRGQGLRGWLQKPPKLDALADVVAAALED
jgi:signal transduction histidine kinase